MHKWGQYMWQAVLLIGVGCFFTERRGIVGLRARQWPPSIDVITIFIDSHASLYNSMTTDEVACDKVVCSEIDLPVL